MTIPVVAFFNNKGGVGKTSLVYHIAWSYADMGTTVLAVDLDPQANLTAAFLDDDEIEALWRDPNGAKQPQTIYVAIKPLLEREGQATAPACRTKAEHLNLLPGDLALSEAEDQFAAEWSHCRDSNKTTKIAALRVTTSLWKMMQDAAVLNDARVILVDLGPNLGALNRAALVSADFVVVPVAPDLFSLRGLHNLGPKLDGWRSEWRKVLDEPPGFDIPAGRIETVGYVVLQHRLRLNRPVQAHARWMNQIARVYGEQVGGGVPAPDDLKVENDPDCLAVLKHYASLMPLAQEARKPIFHLTSADGARGGHLTAARESALDFKKLAEKIRDRSWGRRVRNRNGQT